MDPRAEQFMKDLYLEKLKHKEHRMALLLQKLLYVVSIFGLGTIRIGTIDLNALLYFVPLVALAYDMYIFAEDYKVKRIGFYIEKKCPLSCTEEKDWETWVNKHREPLAPFASFVLTLIVLIASAAIIYFAMPDHTILFVWLPLNVIATASVFYYAKLLKLELQIV